MSGSRARHASVARLDPTAVPQVVDVLHESFYDYPVMRFVLGSDDATYGDRVRTLVHLFVMARVFRDETMLGVEADDGLSAAALVSRPGSGPSPEAYHQLRAEVWKRLGSDAERRYAAFADACAPFQLDVPHLHLNMIGVRRAAQGTGIARQLLEAVHELSSADPESAGVSLTTENPANVTLYRHFGYEIVGTAQVDPTLTTWGFYRENPSQHGDSTP